MDCALLSSLQKLRHILARRLHIQATTMKTKYLAYSKAAAMCADHQHLLGQPFNSAAEDGHARSVSLITVAPYSRILQWSFARQVVKGVSPVEAMKQWAVDRFDVILISQNPANPSDFYIKDLRSFLQERGYDVALAAPRSTTMVSTRP